MDYGGLLPTRATEELDRTPAAVAERAQLAIAAPGVRPSFRRVGRSMNIARTLGERQAGLSRRQAFPSETIWAENEASTKHECEYFDMPPTTKSAISIAFSPDGKTFASTHGDHTVKIICYRTGKILQTLVGHPRTPWSVKYHPTNPRYVASGCLGFQIRFWDVYSGQCLYEATLRHAIISVSFHPSGNIIGIASGTCVYTWDYQHSLPRIAMFSYQTLRSVSFLPDANKLLIGEANEKYGRPLGAVPADLTVTLTMWDYDPMWSTSVEPMATRAMYNPRVLLSHALLYNDGGFDISKCGQYLAVCTDYSLWQAEREAEMDSQHDVDEIQQRAAAVPASESSPQPHILENMASEILSLSQLRHQSHRFYVVQSSSTDQSLQGHLRRRPGTPEQYTTRRLRQRTDSQHALRLSLETPSTTTNDDAASTAVPCRVAQIRPHIASSRTRLSMTQRAQRGQLAPHYQSTWLALISLSDETFGNVMQTTLLAETAAGGVTSVKFSPTGAYVLLGYGVRDRIQRINQFPLHRVTRIYRWEDMTLVSHMESEVDDVNIALFHPLPGHGFIYGTKQGRLRVCYGYRGHFSDVQNDNALRETLDLHALFAHRGADFAMPQHEA
ncbi:hypothetical protein SPRG_09000 [Saprolegnia parasitica CBS 223.65]|uniref:Uncharacterized protein n=1 Tax=Saprolegnia parasitica (strain CBS 223.65) TaxID=695850 RepID=A0A067CGQ9_SAPPC|nr:hypothetical protein SPRG_09000 [Saprolegnia parasitica CBS 223.65]KDO25701.1 hypothetical protein SPRG_09000 [Saprolegnia parasitica CBS 223.65]|eukprot:XP_012203511.1 hypothetical protein SPRG_09000 [Saprolegnia parasitica CBS 223.65]